MYALVKRKRSTLPYSCTWRITHLLHRCLFEFQHGYLKLLIFKFSDLLLLKIKQNDKKSNSFFTACMMLTGVSDSSTVSCSANSSNCLRTASYSSEIEMVIHEYKPLTLHPLSNSYMFWWSDTFLHIIVQLRAGACQVSWSLAPSKWISFCWEHITALRVGANELGLPREEVSRILLIQFRFHLPLGTRLLGSYEQRECIV